jgi:hypothetical protein
MLRQHNNKGPGATWGRGHGPEEGSPNRGLPCHYTPLALTWHKGGRRIVLGKLVALDGRLCLGTAYKWRVMPACVSLPDLAVRILCRLGVQAWLVRDDLRRLCWEIALPELLRAPVRGGERYIALRHAKPVPWRWWPYAERMVDLLELVQALEGRQLELGEVRA